VGIAFQSMTGDAQLIGYVIPCPVVYHFVEDVTRNGRFTGFPSLNIGWQELESKALKAAFGMRPHQKGILVRHVVEGAAAAGALRVDDVVLRVAGVSDTA
jgi:S1-C subfamily serine protease